MALGSGMEVCQGQDLHPGQGPSAHALNYHVRPPPAGEHSPPLGVPFEAVTSLQGGQPSRIARNSEGSLAVRLPVLTLGESGEFVVLDT